MNDDLRRRLESLADRGEPRGADEVLAAARSQVEAAARRQRPTYVAAALAAAVLAVLGTTAVVVHEDGDDQQLAGSAATSTTTTTIAAPALDLTRLTREQRASRLERYASCDALVSATRRKALETVGPYGVPTLANTFATDDVVVGAEESAPLAMSTTDGASARVGGPSAPEFSETNVQEEGIDEPDTVETDGRRLFTLRDRRLWYATLDNGRARIESSIVLDNPTGMVL